MNQFTPDQWTIILTIIAGVVTTFGTVAGLIARNWTQKQTSRLDEAQRQAELAAAEAAKAKTDADSLNKLIDVLSQSQRSRDRKDDAFLEELKLIGKGVTNLTAVDTQRIEKASITAAQVTGAREDIRALSTAFEAGKNDAVAKVTTAMNERIDPVYDRLTRIEALLEEVRELVRPTAPVTQEHHHTGSVEIVPKPEVTDESEEKSA